MPYARFYKLATEKREKLLDVAAQEFARHGFENASVNRILECAQMSKGAAYYYFEDKVDLFIAVVQYANERLRLVDQELDIDALAVENFWITFAELHRQPLLRSIEQPWLFAALRAAGRPRR
jgi:AcrR family transcriptional regulator